MKHALISLILFSIMLFNLNAYATERYCNFGKFSSCQIYDNTDDVSYFDFFDYKGNKLKCHVWAAHAGEYGTYSITPGGSFHFGPQIVSVSYGGGPDIVIEGDFRSKAALHGRVIFKYIKGDTGFVHCEFLK